MSMLATQNLTTQILIGVVGLVFIILGIVTYRRLRYFKQIDFHVVSDSLVLSVQAGREVVGRLKILFDNKPVRNMRLVVIKIRNSGNVPIRPEDHIKPITIDFGNDSEIFEVTMLSTGTSNTNIPAMYDSQKVTIDPFFLNQNDSIEFKVLLTAPFPVGIKVSGLINGIKQLRGFNNVQTRKQLTIFDLVLVFFFYISVILNIVALYYLHSNFNSWLIGIPFTPNLPALLTPFGNYLLAPTGISNLMSHISSVINLIAVLLIFNSVLTISFCLRLLGIKAIVRMKKVRK